MTPHQTRVAVVFGVLVFGALAWTGVILAVQHIIGWFR